MPTIKLVERCQRCPRQDEVEVSLDEAVARVKAGAPRQKALVIALDGKEAVSYDYLCEECRGIVSAYFQGVQKQTKKSTRRFRTAQAGPAPHETKRLSKLVGSHATRLKTAEES